MIKLSLLIIINWFDYKISVPYGAGTPVLSNRRLLLSNGRLPPSNGYLLPSNGRLLPSNRRFLPSNRCLPPNLRKASVCRASCRASTELHAEPPQSFTQSLRTQSLVQSLVQSPVQSPVQSLAQSLVQSLRRAVISNPIKPFNRNQSICFNPEIGSIRFKMAQSGVGLSRWEHWTGDLSLVLLGEVSGIRYLSGRELAALVDKMVKKRLHITLVLDCCFSGGVVRQESVQESVQDAAIRHIAYDSAVDAMYPCAPDSCPNQTCY